MKNYIPNVIVDCHAHCTDDPSGTDPELAALFSELMPWEFPLPMAEFLIEQMDKAGVQYSVLQAYDVERTYISNDYVVKQLKKYPDRFICGYASADPIRRGVKKAIEMLEKYYDLGLRGLKLHPLCMNLIPNDKTLYPLYEKCIEFNIPVGYHLQPVPGAKHRLKVCEIVHIDELAHDLPELKIHICHFGRLPMEPDVIDLACCVLNNENVYTDTSAPIPMTKDGILNTLKLIKKYRMTDKAMFGTDFPINPQSWWIHVLEGYNLGFTKDELDNIYCNNALKFMGREDLIPHSQDEK